MVRRSDASPMKIMCLRHSSLIERMKRSAKAFMFTPVRDDERLDAGVVKGRYGAPTALRPG